MKKIFVSAIMIGLLFPAIAVSAQDNSTNNGSEKIIIIKKKIGPDGQSISIDTLSSLAYSGKEIDPNDLLSIKVLPGLRNMFSINGKSFPSTPTTFLGVMTKANEKGAEVMDVTEGSPAAKAGIEKGDIITKVGAADITSPQKLSDIITGLKSGNKVKIQILRNNKTKEVTAELGERNTNYYSQYFKDLHIPDFSFSGPRNRIEGFGFTNASPSLGLQVQETEDNSGVKVLKVEPGSAAEKAGVRTGDLITALNGSKVTDLNSLLKEKSGVTNRDYDLSILRDQKPMTIAIKIPRKLKQANL